MGGRLGCISVPPSSFIYRAVLILRRRVRLALLGSHLFWFELSLPVVSRQFRPSMTILAASAAFRRGLGVSAADSLGEEVAGAGVVGSNRPTVSVVAARLPRCSTALRALCAARSPRISHGTWRRAGH